MKSKALFIISITIMIIALGSMAINFCFGSFPDWAVRVIGIVMLVNIAILTYASVKRMKSNR
ncbi:hypothetical protein KPL39_12290 [Clostridium gasigenes]|uniref:hypothetical protein n=1 Tax=Clostridium gasigenes TaxID=94869 RepID=UPI001C0BA4D5|nr:hypothetical protein [Clostridium gasigenes]MBU3137045.1 hypothetical protein [Clostridium gasigenes]